MDFEKLIEEAVYREYGQSLNDMKRQETVTTSFMVDVVNKVCKSALNECVKLCVGEK